VEKLVTWTTADPAYPDEERWEHTDSCSGYYGRYGANGKYLEDCARDALEYAAEPYEHLEHVHEIRPDLLAGWDAETVTRKHAKYHEWFGNKTGHTHPDPHAPFAVAEAAETSG
jgi:hypothetical protein